MYLGQAEQDKFVLSVLKNKTDGFFVEIGSNHPIDINNTYLLENQFNWKGIMVEYDNKFLPLYKEHRPNSLWVINDATKIDYLNIFQSIRMPLNIDYLQIDLDVTNGSTIQTLINLDNSILNKYKFATVTFEHDIYNNNHYNTRIASRNIFEKHGYLCVFHDIHNIEPKYPYEDWYVHPELVDMNYITKLIELNKNKYVENSITGTSINWQNIDYNC